MYYYAETNFYDHDGLVTSGGKGRDDYFEMFRRCGLERLVIPTLKKDSRVSAADRLKLESRLPFVWRKALKNLGEGDVLFVHNPPSEKFMAFANVLSEAQKRGCRIVTVVFDLETYLKPYINNAGRLKYQASLLTEKTLLERADHIMVHNDRMKETVAAMGIDPDHITSVGMMDYLREEEPDQQEIAARSGRTLPLIFCGNLVPEKAGFLSEVPDDLEISLYGPGYSGDGRSNIDYKGSVPSVEIMDTISGSFGLVWDGDSAGSPKGTCGEYLKINNPHKIALYIASGFPVIVWKESAMTDEVLRENCGIAVNELSEIRPAIARMTDEEYAQMRENAIRLGRRLRKGEHLQKAIETVLSELEKSSDKSSGSPGPKELMRRLSHNRNRNAYVIFTREPVPGKTKTRLMPYYDAEQCAELHKCFLKDIAREMKGRNFDLIVSYTGGEPHFLKEVFGRKAVYIEQRGDSLGHRMENAVSDALELGYKRVVLTGTDIPELEAETIETAFAMLSKYDIVIGPTADGGYYLAGMSRLHHEAFDVKLYGVSTVFEETVASIREAGLTVAVIDEYNDIDTKEDLKALIKRIRSDASLRHSFTGKYVMGEQKLSVIIPVYNEEAEIGSLIGQLKEYTARRGDAEIIFVDGGSTDRTVPLIGDEFTVIRSPKGRGCQMNAGALSSTGDILFFLHCDSVIPEDFIDEIKKCMADHELGCFGVRFPSRNFFMHTNRLISNHRAIIRGLPFGDQGLFIDRDLFFETGMFPEIPIMEDYAYSRKLRRYGFRPCLTAQRITTSSRRYGKSTKDIALTEFRMWNLRRLYRKGKDINELADMYGDIR